MEHFSRLQNIKKESSTGIVVAGLRGGSGKTIFSVGIIAAIRKLGISVAPFKKGPDYIDAGWLAMAAGRPCHNLDTFLVKSDIVLSSYQEYSYDMDISVVEGNRGLYDCINTKGETSTAALAKLLELPVILCLDVTKTTRTMAAIVSGILAFDSEVRIAGVVLNRVAGIRHQSILSKSIEQYCGLPILGAVPKLLKESFPERHMGLVPTHEHKWAKASIDSICASANEYIDISHVLRIAGYIGGQTVAKNSKEGEKKEDTKSHIAVISCCKNNTKCYSKGKPVIGIMLDEAFQFYYPENLETLEKLGAILVFISPLKDKKIPNVDALYIGGGFPETHARELEKNNSIKKQIKALVEAELPIYAECGGLVYLGKELIIDAKVFSMVGVLPVSFKIWNRPQGHGYTVLKVRKENPYYETGSELLGHEFHYSSVHEWGGTDDQLVFSMKRGRGFSNGKDGISYKNVMATYTHVHAFGTQSWGPALVNRAREYMNMK